MKPSPSSPYETILDSIADGVFTVDKEWRVTSFNRAAERITGLRRAEALGRNCWEVFRADVCEHACVLKKTMKTGKSIVNRTVHIVDHNGRKVPISVSTALLRDRQGTITGGVETFRDLSEVEELRRELLGKHSFQDIVTADHRMLALFETLPAIARSDGAVLLLGDSGTGKELFARAIHNLSHRSKGPFVAVNCGALPENLLESELFGYRRGAFTDAKTDKPGRFDRAKGGTLFLDEIGDIPKPVQVKLLRALQEKTYEPLGSNDPVIADVRIITATNRDIGALVENGTLRTDLYYRINVMTLRLPSLAQRRTDIPLLAGHFLSRLNATAHREITGFSDEAMALLMRYHFPGNVRELENIVHHAFILCTGAVIEPRHLPADLTAPPAKAATTRVSPEEFEADRIRAALEENNYSRSKTARQLGINPATLWRKMKKLGIE
ncbi:MAG: sigma 54-interacting transcriptional regulator [Chitinispirillaceae bacterium]|nr:sigma 54-interacting transcriptional regulator [Chitinispirillaceae bacterium]